jgi:uncharacterized protein
LKIGFLGFLIIAFTLIIGAHIFLHFSWVRFFGIHSPKVSRYLLISLLILSVSFIISMLLIHRYDNFLTTNAYFVSSIWLGTFLYLLLAAIATWIIYLPVKYSGINISLKEIATLLAAFAIGLSSYALWNAAYPAVKNIDITMKNLPSAWRGRKAVQISDVHINSIRGQGYMSRIVRQINEVKPDIVFITGDLFDGMGDDLVSLVKPLNDINAPLGIYYITGNHEMYLGVDKALTALATTKVKILRDELVEIDSMQILGLDYGGAWEGRKFENGLGLIDKSKTNIVLYHAPIQLDKFKAAGVNLQLAGHTHHGQLWPFNYISHAVYSGYDYGLYQDSDYILYCSCGTGTWGPPMRTASRSEIVVFNFK